MYCSNSGRDRMGLTEASVLKADHIAEKMSYIDKFGVDRIFANKQFVNHKQVASPKRCVSNFLPCARSSSVKPVLEHSPPKQFKESVPIFEQQKQLKQMKKEGEIRNRKSMQNRNRRKKLPTAHPKGAWNVEINMEVDDDVPSSPDIKDYVRPPPPFVLTIDIPLIHSASGICDTNQKATADDRPPVRARLPSECESEDSFIVFGDMSELDEDLSSDEGDSDTDQLSDLGENSCIPRKKVRFAPDADLCDFHPMIQWSYAYQNARKGPWEQFARDRERFKKRIADTGQVLAPVLQPLHRIKVFDDRFREND